MSNDPPPDPAAQQLLPFQTPPLESARDAERFLEGLKRDLPELFSERPRRSPAAVPPPQPAQEQGVLWPEGDPARARCAIEARVEHWSPVIGVRCRRICVRDQKTLWGSCASGGTLSFNWRLVLAPAEVLDYVVIHELCHLLEMNHSKKFWHLVNRFCPGHKKSRRWLRANSEELRRARPVTA
jgi:predicted metal-dependent hydrolase